MLTPDSEGKLRNDADLLPVQSKQQLLDADGNSASLNTREMDNISNSENIAADGKANLEVTDNTEMGSMYTVMIYDKLLNSNYYNLSDYAILSMIIFLLACT